MDWNSRRRPGQPAVLPPEIPVTCQITPEPSEPETCAVKVWRWPTLNVAEGGVSVTVTPPVVEVTMVTGSVAAFDGSAIGVAVSVTRFGTGAPAGAV